MNLNILIDYCNTFFLYLLCSIYCNKPWLGGTQIKQIRIFQSTKYQQNISNFCFLNLINLMELYRQSSDDCIRTDGVSNKISTYRKTRVVLIHFNTQSTCHTQNIFFFKLPYCGIKSRQHCHFIYIAECMSFISNTWYGDWMRSHTRTASGVQKQIPNPLARGYTSILLNRQSTELSYVIRKYWAHIFEERFVFIFWIFYIICNFTSDIVQKFTYLGMENMIIF